MARKGGLGSAVQLDGLRDAGRTGLRGILVDIYAQSRYIFAQIPSRLEIFNSTDAPFVDIINSLHF